MEDFNNRRVVRPQIGFELNRIMTVNKRIVSLADISANTLFGYIDNGREQIDTQLGVLNGMRRYRGGAESNPHILVGMLALSGYEYNALSLEGMETDSDLDITETGLHVDYREFWHSVDHALYRPVVHKNVLMDYPDLGGAWLGLSRPE